MFSARHTSATAHASPAQCRTKHRESVNFWRVGFPDFEKSFSANLLIVRDAELFSGLGSDSLLVQPCKASRMFPRHQ